MFAIIKPQIDYGNFSWCENPKFHKWSFSQNPDRKFPEKKIRITIDIEVMDELLCTADKMMIFDQSGFCPYITLGKLQRNMTVRFKLNDKYQNSLLTIIFFKQEQIKYTEHFVATLRVPVLDIKGDNSCAICLDGFPDSNNIYITPCSHNFHISCLFEFLNIKKLIRPQTKECVLTCTHGDSVENFTCPTCRQEIRIN